MIFVFQDQTKVPNSWLKRVAKLQIQLEALGTSAARKAFIDKHAAEWGKIKNELFNMSYQKCWYSEAPDAVSDWHVDHFRPKKRAVDMDETEHEGYHWLAFDWMNYRIAGSYPNSPHKDDKGKTRGKWDYFPLAKGSVRATWAKRDFKKEMCLLLDPAKKSDPKLLTFDEKGEPIPADPKNPIAVRKVRTTIHFLFLDSPRLIAARKKKWRETLEWIEEYHECCPDDIDDCTLKDYRRFERHLDRLGKLTGPKSSYAATARACLRANGLGNFIEAPEEALAA